MRSKSTVSELFKSVERVFPWVLKGSIWVYWVLDFESFSQFYKFSFISKIIFQFLPLDVGFTSNHVNYCVIFFFTFIYHVYISSEVVVTIILVIA